MNGGSCHRNKPRKEKPRWSQNLHPMRLSQRNRSKLSSLLLSQKPLPPKPQSATPVPILLFLPTVRLRQARLPLSLRPKPPQHRSSRLGANRSSPARIHPIGSSAPLVQARHWSKLPLRREMLSILNLQQCFDWSALWPVEALASGPREADSPGISGETFQMTSARLRGVVERERAPIPAAYRAAAGLRSSAAS